MAIAQIRMVCGPKFQSYHPGTDRLDMAFGLRGAVVRPACVNTGAWYAFDSIAAGLGRSGGGIVGGQHGQLAALVSAWRRCERLSSTGPHLYLTNGSGDAGAAAPVKPPPCSGG